MMLTDSIQGTRDRKIADPTIKRRMSAHDLEVIVRDSRLHRFASTTCSSCSVCEANAAASIRVKAKAEQVLFCA